MLLCACLCVCVCRCLCVYVTVCVPLRVCVCRCGVVRSSTAESSQYEDAPPQVTLHTVCVCYRSPFLFFLSVSSLSSPLFFLCSPPLSFPSLLSFLFLVLCMFSCLCLRLLFCRTVRMDSRLCCCFVALLRCNAMRVCVACFSIKP